MPSHARGVDEAVSEGHFVLVIKIVTACNSCKIPLDYIGNIGIPSRKVPICIIHK
jgi:hypothetical protein